MRFGSDNLRHDRKYLTSWLSAGFTNDVMTLGNIIYLAILTHRTPILPAFDSYIGKYAQPIPFSAIFDIDYLQHTLRMPILEWKDVKDITAEETDVLGCWNVYEVADIQATGPRYSRGPNTLLLDLPYTLAPPSVKLIPGFMHDSHMTFWSLAPLSYSDHRAKALALPEDSWDGKRKRRPGQRMGRTDEPDEQVLCFDYLFYACADMPFEYEHDPYPSWDIVQKHFRWTSEVKSIGNAYLRKALGVSESESIPPHITIHARHGDFRDWCNEVDVQACFAPLSVFAVRVNEIKEELSTRKGIDTTYMKVIMTSDESDPKWWQDVEKMGWIRINHGTEKTAVTYGDWYPVIIDAYMQSAGMGFVGTDRSTFSNLARRRVQEWNDGAVRTVKWGRPDADSH
ncbi:hypothetical protein K474DRAFT_1600968 [Panus rudis PR-1116 ss-1]|nr:hypothetical protein K474DRAFT_1600968 [Panus rudis PR-1116 ss-1]